PEATRVEPVVRDVPSAIRGTIGAESSFRGTDPVLVSGYGLVVGLPGTGGGPYPTPVMATMEREIARQGMGRATFNEGHALAGLTPRQILDSTSVAIVIVEGVVPPGAPRNGIFDVRVRKLAGSAVTSLEGGTLWTTDLRFGPPSVTGGMQARALGEARGPVFINPFAEPGGVVLAGAASAAPATDAQPAADSGGEAAPIPEADGIIRTTGRILGGGRITDPLALELVLDNASHARASAIQGAINARFPIEPGQREPTARGRGPASIAITIPPSYRLRSSEFIRLVQGLRTETGFGDEFARRAVQELEQTPALAEQLGWILQAIGQPALPFVSKLYDHPELVPRLAALRVGARLGDIRAAAPLRTIATDANQPMVLRAEAAELLGSVPNDPSTDLALRAIASDSTDLELRLAAYTAMIERDDPSIRRERVIIGGRRSGSNMEKFELHLVPAKEHLVYVTQTGRPRIVVFGSDATLARPSLAGIWSDRLLVAADGPDDAVRMMFRDWRSEGASARQTTIGPTLAEFIRTLAHKTTPEEPEIGFDLSYSQVVGAIYNLQRAGTITAAFAVERDRLVDRMTEAQRIVAGEDRAENRTTAAAQREQRARLISAANQPIVKPTTPEPGSMVVPLPPRQAPR
ncbi:MAG: flagellar basal body P-ring protein FlgI, partial [Phycisphaerales bacterium]|nr:flagellar basal body P-ring protein FlgI [Phycisphaerales bacterium]